MQSISYRSGYAGLYVHFPYCIHKCSYCDFYSVGIGKQDAPNQKLLFQTYKQEFEQRLILDPSIKNYKFDTIFIGGGTPSLANLDLLAELIDYIKLNLEFSKDTEFTMEMNPEDISPDKLSLMHSIGVNRINAGIQSFDKNLLKTLDRYNDEEKYSLVLNHLSNSKIKRFGIDLIYGIPGQTLDMFLDDLNKSINARVTHISLYSLTVEKGTEYAKQLRKKQAKPPNEDLQMEILEILPPMLRKKGYNQYEVSNYCMKGEESLHNLKYWTMEKYLSLGPGAHGYTNKGRYFNHRSIEKYLNSEIGIKYETPKLLEELALCLFRLFLPVDIKSFSILIPDKITALENLLVEWDYENLCTFKDGIFQWNEIAVTRLDEFILKISEL
ncbi:MAG: radical SAM family heme chaperone HemW [Leptospiraceae bacterium]|nr:radical SAM family heme chaperone HemW [Leptospiraceae bacterium]